MIQEADGTIGRVERSMVLVTVAELKTKRIAQRLLDPILARINPFDYRSSKFTSVDKFADVWEPQVLTHQKPSSVKAVKSHLKTYIRKHLGKVLLHELSPQIQQNVVTLLSQKVSRKTVLNVFGTLSSMMRTAKSWGTAPGLLRQASWHYRQTRFRSKLDSLMGKRRARSSRSLPNRTERCLRLPP